MRAIAMAMSILTDTLDRCRPAFMVAEVLLFIVASGFWAFSSLGGDMMHPAIYGAFATAYPAKMWAMAMMVGCALVINGLIRPINNWMVATGGAILCANFAAIAYSAIFTGGEFVIGIFASVFFLSWHVWLTLEALLHERD